LRSYLRFSCRDQAVADDLLQESFLRLLQRDLPPLDERELKSYLYKTAHSVLVDSYRRTERDRHLEHEIAVHERATSPAPEIPGDVQRVLDQLKPRDQQLLWLAYVEGFSHSEIAGLIEVNEKSVRVLLLRARARAANVLADHGIGRKEAK
jgi:RNA polymerase sigma-70 factor (ECF subfamily)